MRIVLLSILVTLLSACSIQKTYYDAAMGVARDDERAGDLKSAEQNYASAVLRAKNHLGDKEISSALYDMGSFYRRHGQYEISITKLNESISHAIKAGSFSELAMGRRYITISAAHAELGQWKEGAIHLKKITPYWQKYTGNELAFAKAVFTVYHQKLTELGEDVEFIPNKSLNQTGANNVPPG